MSNLHLPQHIAIVMDGNGRWAKKRFLPRIAGHKAGVDAARRMVKACAKMGIPVLSLFAFSSENWRRPPQEVTYLMDLFLSGLEREAQTLNKNNIQLRFIGSRKRFHTKLLDKINEVEQLTAKNTGLILLIAVDYGGQWDICHATQHIALQVQQQQLDIEAITPELFAKHLSFADLPDPDLFIRTSGELRLSNFMLWQLAYAELYFTDCLWPDVDENVLHTAIQQFQTRERRFGARLSEKEDSIC